MMTSLDNYDANKLTETDKEYVWHHLLQHAKLDSMDPFIITEGKGAFIKDSKGNEYLDAVAGGVWVVNVGYGRESMAKAVYDQLVKLPFYAGVGGTVPGTIFAEKLIELVPHMKRVYYSNSGSEANEKAYKMIRQKAHNENEGKKHKIIFRDRDYHGTTIANLSACGHAQRKEQYGPFVDGFVEIPSCNCYRCPFNKKYGECNIECATVVEDVIKKEGPETVGSVMLEPITAGGGILPPVKEYFPIIAEICKKYDVLLHIDEVVCGIGRTGKWFGFQHYGIKPDIVTMAKGVASGYAAISITMTTDEIFDSFKTDVNDTMGYFRDISTFGGCAAGPAAAIENMRIIKEEKLLENSTNMGNYLLDKLKELKEKHAHIGDVRGVGLFLGVELVKDKQTRTPLEEARVMSVLQHAKQEGGVLVGSTSRSLPGFNNTLTLSPSLTCTKSEADTIVAALDKAIAKI